MPLPTLGIEGRVVGDVQFKFTDEGMAVARFRMVASDRKQVDGRWVEGERLWLTISCFRKLAENVADSIRDNDLVLVYGKLSTAEWVEPGGEKRSAPKFVASSVGPALSFEPRPGSGAPAERRGRENGAQRRQPAPEPVAAGGGGNRYASEEGSWGAASTYDDPWA